MGPAKAERNFYTGNANPRHRQVPAQRASAHLFGNAGRPLHSERHLYRVEHAGYGRASSARLRQPDSTAWSRTRWPTGRPELGLAYRLNDKTLIRAAYSRFYDDWADILQLSQNFGGNWPAVNTLQNNGLNTATSNGYGRRSAAVWRRWGAHLSDQRLQPGQPVDGGSELPDSGLRSVERGYRTGSCRAI